jgi:hypothetical protein
MTLRLQVVSCFSASQDQLNWKDMSDWCVQQAGDEKQKEKNRCGRLKGGGGKRRGRRKGKRRGKKAS